MTNAPVLSLRKQNGAVTGIMTSAVQLNDRTNRQLERTIRKETKTTFRVWYVPEERGG